MATTPLRGDPFIVDSNLAPQQLEALDASGMNSLQRGWAAGRIGNDANSLSAEELNLRASGDVAGADALRRQITALQLRQGAFAPQIGRVEDVNSLGDVGSYVAGQVGQGGASMVDPMAVSAGLNTVGRFLPGAAGKVAQGAALAVPYLMNQRQLTGEFGNSAYQDPELIARTSPTQLRDSANIYGAGASVLDTALPGIVGRQISGLSRATGAAARKSAMGPGLKTLGEMGLEGATETAQSVGSQYTQGLLNPNRDTSGDFSENLNSFVGGAVGAGPFAAAGSYAEAGHNRVGAGVDRVKDAAGSVIDMANNNETLQSGVAQGKKMFGKAKDQVIDITKGDDGEASFQATVNNLKTAAEDAYAGMKSSSQLSAEESAVIAGIPPDEVMAKGDDEIASWLNGNDESRANLIDGKLAEMDDPAAAEILDRIQTATDPEAQHAARNEGATLLRGETFTQQAQRRANSFGENMKAITGIVGPAIGKGAVAAGKGVAGFAKSIIDGAKGASKKNAQTDGTESFQDWRDSYYDVPGKTAAEQALLKGESYNKAVDFGQRADLAAAYAEDMAKRGRAQKGDMGRVGRNVAFLLADMTSQFSTPTAGSAPRAGLAAREAKLNRLTTDLHGAYRAQAPEVLTQLGRILGPDAKQAVDYMTKELQLQMAPKGAMEHAAKRDMLAQEVVGLVPAAAQSKLMALGVNLNTPKGREDALHLMEDYADGIGGSRSADVRKTLDRMFSPEGVNAMLTYLNGQEEVQKGKVIDDRGQIEGTDRGGPMTSDDLGMDDFETEAADKMVVKGSGPKIYAYGNGAGLRSSDERRDPFAAAEKADAETGVVKRPALFTKGQKLFGGADAIEKKIADLKAKLVADPEYPDHDNYRVEAKTAWDVMQDNKMQPGKVLQIYRDYMRADAKDEKLSKGERKYATQQGKLAHSMILDGIQKQEADGQLVKHKFSSSPRDRSELTKTAKAYFQERYIVTAEQMSNRDPEKISVTEVLGLVKGGRGKLDAVRRDTMDMSEGDQKLAESEANILYFTGKDEKNKSATLPIQAGSLVYLVRQQQGKTSRMDVAEKGKSFNNKTKNDEYLADLLTGIGMLVDSGQVTGMPYMLDRFGKATSFEKAVPKSLMLATQTYGDMKFGEEKRREKFKSELPAIDPAKREQARYALAGAKQNLEAVLKDKNSTTDDELIARNAVGYATKELAALEAAGDKDVEKDQAKNSEFFTPEDLAEREMQESAWSVDKRRSGKNDTSTAASATDAGGELVTRGANNRDINNPSSRGTSTSIRVDVSGKRAVEAKTKSLDKTELDFSKGQGKGVDDETTDVLKRTKLGGKSAYSTDIGPEPKAKAADQALRRAEAIGAAYNRSEDEAKAMIEMRFRMAAAPAYSENKNEAVGGPHYIAPVAAFVNSKNLANMDLGPKELAEFSSIRARVAQVLMGDSVSKTERVKLTRLMSTDPAKVTAMNVDAMLTKLVGKGEQKLGSDKAPINDSRTDYGYEGSAKTALLDAAIAKRRGYITNPPADYSIEKVKDTIDWATTQQERVDAEVAKLEKQMDGPTFDYDRYDAMSGLQSDLRLLVKAAKAQIQNEKDMAEADKKNGTNLFGGAAAPLGKPSGGRKLNAMSADIHTDLERGGFAATHDSPIRHEGKLDWRAHQGKGEGNASFGAGTYLSTAEGVHKSYKEQFTAAVSLDAEERLKDNPAYAALRNELNALYKKGIVPADAVSAITSRMFAMEDALPKGPSPTYEVSVDIKPEQLLDWGKPLSEQSEVVRGALVKAGFEDSSAEIVKARARFDKADRALKAVAQGDPVDEEARSPKAYEKAVDERRQALFHLDWLTENDLTGRDTYRRLAKKFGSQAKASDYLQSLGILGHKYAASGGRNDIHPNYVIYDDSKITTNYVHFNAQEQSGPSKVSTQAERDEAVAYALKVLGPKIKVSFKDITGYSGEFIEAQNTIEISTTAAAGTMNTLFHEAMHKFFADFVRGNPKMQAVFESLVNDPKHIQKLHALLDGYPAAQAQLTSGEERLAYTYQFWKAGLLQVDAKAHTWLQKVGKFFRAVLGMVRDSERALELFEAFDQGKMSEPSAAGQVIAKALSRGTNALKLRRQMDGMMQGLAALTFPAAEILGNSKSPTARKLSKMMFTNPGEESHGGEETGMMNARRNVAQQYINVANRKFESMSQVDKDAVQKFLQQGTDPSEIKSSEQREAVKDIRQLLDRFHKYMTDAGMEIGKVDNYYPVVWNPDRLNANKAEFVNMLVTKYAEQMNSDNPAKAAERIWQSLVNKEGVDAHLPVGREDGVLSPFFASQEMRTLPWLEAADREKYLDKNMPLTLTRYFNQGAHATEYFRRFGENGIKLDKMLADVRSELSSVSKEMMKRDEIKGEPARVKWVARQMRDVSQSVGAMEGTLGKDISPNMRKFNSWMAVYQNIRVLPMALFSSFVDPLALVARGAPWQAAYETFTYSMREVFRGWADVFKDMPPEREKDEWRKLAELIGASEIAMFQHHVSEEYSSTYMTPGAKKINDKMFVFNGMEAWNRGNRIMATKWAVNFLETHAGLPDKVHSRRWLAELGLNPAQIVLDDGKLVTSPQQLSVLKGITLDEARKQIAPIHDALNRWVEGAVLTPNAAQRPAWSSDPNFATMFHLKQFSYSFHQTILKRATNEFSKGNMQPLGALAMFIPTMIGADLMKGLIQGAGTLPPYMASMNAGDWLMHGSQRAGLSGIGVIGMDAANDWASLGGPAFEQIIDAGRDGFGSKSALNAMPLHSLYGTLISRGAVAPA